MVYLFAVLYGMTAFIAVCAVVVRLKLKLPLWRSVAITAAALSITLASCVLAFDRFGLALVVLVVGYLVTAYGAFYWFATDSFLESSILWPWPRQHESLQIPVAKPRTRPTMYQRVQLVSPQTLHRARRIVKDPKLRNQIDALLQVYKQGKHLHAVA